MAFMSTNHTPPPHLLTHSCAFTVLCVLQLAYWKLNGTSAATYESCSTSAFKKGRTETVRPLTMATRHACELFHKEDSNPDQLYEAMQECTKVHNQLTKEAAMGELVEWCRKLLWWRYFYLETKWHDILHVTLCFTCDVIFYMWRDILHVGVIFYMWRDIFRSGLGPAYVRYEVLRGEEGLRAAVLPGSQLPEDQPDHSEHVHCFQSCAPDGRVRTRHTRGVWCRWVSYSRGTAWVSVIPEGYSVGECHIWGVWREWVSYLRGMAWVSVIPKGYSVGECHTWGVQRGWVSYLRGMV